MSTKQSAAAKNGPIKSTEKRIVRFLIKQSFSYRTIGKECQLLPHSKWGEGMMIAAEHISLGEHRKGAKP